MSHIGFSDLGTSLVRTSWFFALDPGETWCLLDILNHGASALLRESSKVWHMGEVARASSLARLSVRFAAGLSNDQVPHTEAIGDLCSLALCFHRASVQASRVCPRGISIESDHTKSFESLTILRRVSSTRLLADRGISTGCPRWAASPWLLRG